MNFQRLTSLARNTGRLELAMPSRLVSLLIVVALALGFSFWTSASFAQEQPADQTPAALSKAQIDELAEKSIAILRENCFGCHGTGEKVRGKLVLTNRNALIAGGESGPAVDVESPDDSLVLDAINYGSYEMPPDGKLSDEDIDTLTQWVRAGTPWSGDETEAKPADGHSAIPTVNAETKKWWSYQPVVRPEVPTFDAKGVNPIDQFILEGLDRAELVPNPPADRGVLVRRAYYDLIGLPPTPEQVDAFVNDESPDAWERLIDELLASPHYGEKWGRHWLDLVRYGESNSYERDDTKPFVWRYRDYVIQSFNADKPYDEFLIEQLAGDELDEVTPDRIIATGYYRLGIWDDEPADPEQAWYDDTDDILATTSQTMLGMTINCARCHDHKIDPVPQKDYYRMLAFFRNIRRYGVRAHETVVDASLRTIAPPEMQMQNRAEKEAWHAAIDQNREALEAIEAIAKKDFIPVEFEEFKDEMKRVDLVRKRVGTAITEEQATDYAKLMDEMRRLRQNPPAQLESALCVKEKGPAPDETFVLIRGNAHAPSDRVEPGFPSVLSPPEPEIEATAEGKSTGRRLALARWIASRDNPLTARVMANRLWQFHFGRGIVRSTSDFGFQGTPPTHPELLDWLASELVDGDWHLKQMHKLIMTSAAYKMSSAENPEALAADPLNDYFWRYDMRRLTAEEVRDSILAVNGTLNAEKLFGPSIYPVQPDEVLQGQSVPGANWFTSSGDELNRRSIYIHTKRSLPVPLLANFDVADPDTPCPVRFNTVQPTQALGMINSEFVHNQARAFADDLRQQAPDNETQQVEMALHRVLQRTPTAAEIERGIEFISALRVDEPDSAEAMQNFCLLVLNLNEFLYLD